AKGDTIVLALDRHDESLATIEREFDSPNLITCLFDLNRTEDIADFVHEIVREHGPIKQLVNNAGTWDLKSIVELDEASWDSIFAVNVKAPFILIRELAPVISSTGGGAIVNIASRNAMRSSTKNAAYDASKAALLALTRTAAGELARYGIRVNAVCPGMIHTPPNDSLMTAGLFFDVYRRLIPMNRFGLPEEIAGVVAFLLSQDASFVTGESIIADGGQIACQDSDRLMEIPKLNG
ncbi:MAG: SDR family oxidoreductase, partial [Planctomycetes bacterium]|nr:SDR family oxidoreductase [Planctomycetota bacterium]